MSFKITGSGSYIPSVVENNDKFLNNFFVTSQELDLIMTTKLLLINSIQLQELLRENIFPQI